MKHRRYISKHLNPIELKRVVKVISKNFISFWDNSLRKPMQFNMLNNYLSHLFAGIIRFHKKEMRSPDSLLIFWVLSFAEHWKIYYIDILNIF